MPNVTFTYLGTGTSNGVPLIGCDCPVCASDDPRNRRRRCSALVETPGAKILIDCGPDFRNQALDIGLNHLDYVLITHEHNDHINGIDELRALNFRMRRSIPIISAKQTGDVIRHRYDYCFNPRQKGGGVPQLDMQTCEPLVPMTLGGVEFLPIPYKHGILDVLGWRIGGPGGMTYITDCSFLPEESFEAVKGSRILTLNALRPKAHETHYNIEQAIEMSGRLEAGQTYFTHMTHDVDHARDDALLPEGINFAYDGLKLEIDVPGA